MIYVIPVVLCLIFAVGAARKVKLYDSFVAGVKEAVGLSIRLLPYLAVVFMAMELMRASGLSAMLGKAVSPKGYTSSTASIRTYRARQA